MARKMSPHIFQIKKGKSASLTCSFDLTDIEETTIGQLATATSMCMHKILFDHVSNNQGCNFHNPLLKELLNND